MLTHDGDEMFLTETAERVCADLVKLGAVPTSGHRSVAEQAHAMAVNVSQKRDWIGLTYRHGAALQDAVNVHPEWATEAQIEEGLYVAMMADQDAVRGLSWHLLNPCSCFDLDPTSVTVSVRQHVAQWAREQVITKVLENEGGLARFHVECAALPENKVVEV